MCHEKAPVHNSHHVNNLAQNPEMAARGSEQQAQAQTDRLLEEARGCW